jgi:hypothetical protein
MDAGSNPVSLTKGVRTMVSILPVSILVLSILAWISILIVDNIQWQEKIRKLAGIFPIKKIKLKKGQQIIFQEGEVNPFEQTPLEPKGE